MSDARARRLQLFTGKGGVGKTTVVAGAALAWAQRGRRPLVVELGRRASMEAALEAGPIGWEPREVAPGVHATNVDAERATVEVAGRWLGSRRLAARALRAESLQAFLGAAPGVTEIATLERLVGLLDEVDAAGAPAWSPILVDADATGHALMFLSVPRVLEELGAGGPLARLLVRGADLLGDARRTAVHLVTLADALPVQETLELEAALASDGRIAPGVLVVNRSPGGPAIPAGRASELAAHAATHGAPALARDLALLAEEQGRAERQRARIALLARRIARPIVELPDLEAIRLGRAALERLGRALLEGT